MRVFVDADACPVVGIIEKVAREHNVPVTLLCDTNHVLSSAYSEVIVVGAGADAVDYKLIRCSWNVISTKHSLMEHFILTTELAQLIIVICLRTLFFQKHKN